MDKKNKNRKPTGKNKETAPKSPTSNFYPEINDGIQAYERHLNNFKREYEKWNITQKVAISELKDLVKEVHDAQLNFNNTNLFFKQVNLESRMLRTNDNSNLDFFASMASLATDVIGGITSVAQAFDVDSKMKKFGEIMEGYAEDTKPLHVARSRCFDRYKNVEEIIRKYHSETFSSTLTRISDAIDVEDMWLEIKGTCCNNDLPQVIEKVDDFFRQASRAAVFNEICSSVASYVDSNPAVIDACMGAGKTLIGVFDACSAESSKNNALVRSSSILTNRALISRGQSEISELQRLVNNEDEPQAKLELKIREAISDLEREADEMERLYRSCSSLRFKQQTFDPYNYL